MFRFNCKPRQATLLLCASALAAPGGIGGVAADQETPPSKTVAMIGAGAMAQARIRATCGTPVYEGGLDNAREC